MYYKFCRERLRGGLRWEWIPCAVVPRAFANGFCNIIQFCLKIIWWFYWFKKCYGRRGSWCWWGKLAVRLSWIIYLKVETSRVDVNKACGLDGPWNFIVLQLGDLLFQLRLLSSCLVLLHFILFCCILLTMYSMVMLFLLFLTLE